MLSGVFYLESKQHVKEGNGFQMDCVYRLDHICPFNWFTKIVKYEWQAVTELICYEQLNCVSQKMLKPCVGVTKFILFES